MKYNILIDFKNYKIPAIMSNRFNYIEVLFSEHDYNNYYDHFINFLNQSKIIYTKDHINVYYDMGKSIIKEYDNVLNLDGFKSIRISRLIAFKNNIELIEYIRKENIKKVINYLDE